MDAYRYYILGYVLGSFIAAMCTSQQVFFGLKGRGSEDQALRRTEMDVSITCNVSCDVNASIEIFLLSETGPRTSIRLVQNNHCHSLDYDLFTVPQKTQFKCSVKYNDSTNGFEVSKEMFWFPHIIQDKAPVYCRRNGTVSKPYKIGDKLLLECFCNLTLTTSCKWVSSTNGTKTDVPNTSVNMNADYKVYSVVVGPISAADESTGYTCEPSDQSSHTGQSCFIQTMSDSTSDYVYNPILSSFCELTNTFSSPDPEASNNVTGTYTPANGSPRQPIDYISPTSDKGLFLKTEILIVIGISICVMILIFIGIVLAVILMRKNKKNTKEKEHGAINDYYETVNKGNKEKENLADTIDPYDISSFQQDKTNQLSSQESNGNTNVDPSKNDNYTYATVNKKTLPRGTQKESQSEPCYDLPNVSSGAEIDFSDLYAKVQK